MELHLLDSIIILLVIAVTISTVFHRLRIPPIVGYLLVGIAVGPHAWGFISNTQITQDIAEFGVVFLMFMIGLEFSLSRLLAMKKIVFGLGGLQVVLTILATTMVSLFLGMTMAEAIIVGGIVAMSSTAIVTKQLTDQLELNSRHGFSSVGILLFQDLAVIPLLILVPSLANVAEYSIGIYLAWSLVKGCAAILLILMLGRWVLKPVFYHIASTYSLELFTLTALLVTLGSAWITHHLGVSMALGAFLAGMMLGETEFRHQIEADIRPFRDVLLGFFFISVGMQLDLHIVLDAWMWLLLLLVAIVVFKIILITSLGLLFRLPLVTSCQTAVILSHGGEFGFAILTLAVANQLLPPDYAQVVLGAILMSMLLAPILIRHNYWLVTLFFPSLSQDKTQRPENKIFQLASGSNDHVLICGYGRVGQNVASFLRKVEIPYIALDLDPSRIENAVLAGESVCYGDASRHEVLQLAGIDRAQALVISFSNQAECCKILEIVRRVNKNIPIIVRSHDDYDGNMYYAKGATEVIPESIEASMMLASHVLLMMKVPGYKVHQLLEESRHSRYDLLRMVFPAQDTLSFEELDEPRQGLHPVFLPEGAYAVGQTIAEVGMVDVRVTALRRGKERIVDPDKSLQLEANDTVVLFGELSNLERAENSLLNGEN